MNILLTSLTYLGRRASRLVTPLAFPSAFFRARDRRLPYMRPHSLVLFRITGCDGLYTVEWLPMFLVNLSALGAAKCHRMPKVDCLRIFRNTVLMLWVLEGGTPLDSFRAWRLKMLKFPPLTGCSQPPFNLQPCVLRCFLFLCKPFKHWDH